MQQSTAQPKQSGSFPPAGWKQDWLPALGLVAITILASVNTTFAEVDFGQTITLPDTPTAPAVMIDPTVALTQNFGLIDLGTATSVDAGEMALVSNTKRNATVRCLSPCEITVLGKEDFQALSAGSSVMAQAIKRQIEERVAPKKGKSPTKELPLKAS